MLSDWPVRLGNFSGTITACQTLRVSYGSVHTMQEKFENGVFTLKMCQMFSVRTTPAKIENETITDHFGFVCVENSVRLSLRHRFF